MNQDRCDVVGCAAFAPPVGATVPYLPDEADEEMVDGKKYFVYEGTYYRAFASDDEVVYMVVDDPHEA